MKKQRPTLLAIIAMIPMWIVAISISLFLSECTNSETYTPRRTAFPRLNLCDTLYVKSTLLPINFEINAETIATSDSSHTSNDGSKWINVFYPKYNATLYCTYTPVSKATINNVIENRIERISLNIGSNSFELIENNNISDVDIQVFSTPTNIVTPLQFIATNNSTWVISGAFCFNERDNISTDSISPIIKAVKNDILHTTSNLRDNAR